MRNEYLDQVQEQQQRLEVDLKARKMASPMSVPAQAAGMAPRRRGGMGAPPPPEMPGGNAVDVRVTGFWRWKNVVVPPNAYVVHTRRGHDKPLHIGLGVSFRFNPAIDSFLVVPGAMQTILINAHCICRELQGLLVQGYVQWIIEDFATAYKKLDFTDVDDPMRVVNVQLREQAEAAIKDKVATMSIDAVLSDKQPIIEELTARIRQVAEGGGGSDKGLGLRIVTVQIKEAVVSSARLWESLQKPFRAERERVARLAGLETEEAISRRELQVKQERERSHLETEGELSQLRAHKDAEAYDRKQAEELRRQQREEEAARTLAVERQQSALHTAELHKARLAVETELAQLKHEAQAAQRKREAQASLEVLEAERTAGNKQKRFELELLEARQHILNGLSPANVQSRLVELLPTIAEKMPQPQELRSFSIGTGAGIQEGQALTSLVAQMMALVKALRPEAEVAPAKLPAPPPPERPAP
ncbi:SPFH domain-containing protein [Hyalangium rubrum]|uniref:SPFH domain-containing protein n=1 Tax=Hyalangium rubrum TaxID=3103134 RepID=A0ABU5HE73_9BACT|nr:SPFH domain-containing protein [Hyalangium sp. s54d21]MDY7231442.1 SPFH domain-containing protein [Hyalangium sp. s54d21]